MENTYIYLKIIYTLLVNWNSGLAITQASGRKEGIMEEMTDKQFDKILKMVAMILDGCKDLDEAKAKVKELIEKEKPAE